MAVGFQEARPAFVLARQSTWPDGGFIENASLAGFTTADACSFFFDHYKSFRTFTCHYYLEIVIPSVLIIERKKHKVTQKNNRVMRLLWSSKSPFE